jgi:hypothetical protein
MDVDLVTRKVFLDVSTGENAFERNWKSARLIQAELPLWLGDIDFLFLHPFELLSGHAQIEHRDVYALTFGLLPDGQDHSFHKVEVFRGASACDSGRICHGGSSSKLTECRPSTRLLSRRDSPVKTNRRSSPFITVSVLPKRSYTSDSQWVMTRNKWFTAPGNDRYDFTERQNLTRMFSSNSLSLHRGVPRVTPLAWQSDDIFTSPDHFFAGAIGTIAKCARPHARPVC